jgi:hypothetical protein
MQQKMGEISDRIQQELKSWPGVTVHDHNFGGLEFRVNGKEMGHMHGDEMVDLPFPKADGKKLISEGKASAHHFIPQSGWLSYRIEKTEDVAGAIDLFRLQYKRMTSKNSKWWKL